MTAYHWSCLTCPDHGTTTATKTGIDDASRHTDLSSHTTVTSTTAELAARYGAGGGS